MAADKDRAAYDRYLGMDRAITRRDFLNGMAVTIGASLLPGKTFGTGEEPEAQERPGYYPPTLTGMRGSQPGSFEVAHSLRDGTFWQHAAKTQDTGEAYDLVVVGGGISGLAAAHFFRERASRGARILILENHDDFGGHARRNEFHLGGKLQLMNGGTMLIDSPTPYSRQANSLLKKLGIDPPKLAARYNDEKLYSSLGLRPAVFFDKETFGEDRLVAGEPGGNWQEGSAAGGLTWKEFLARTPLPAQVQREIERIQEAKVDYMPGLTSAEKKDRLSRMSYKDFLLKVVKADAGVIPFYQTRTNGEWGVGIDAEPALDCWALGLPGFQGMKLEPGAAPRMSYTAAGYANGGSYRFHFPDGNATIARLLVRDLIPQAVPGSTAEDVVTAKVDYGQLDQPGAPVRLRLNSTVVRARNAGDPAAAREVEVTYASGKQVFTARAKNCILACWNMIIPHLVPELPEKQKQGLHYLVKVPLVYASVGIGNWTALHKLGIRSVRAPGAYWMDVALNWPVNIGEYQSPKSPEEPMVLFLSRTPCKPGLAARQQQIAGRYELLSTSFEQFERAIRDQLARTLRAGGFDPARDIEAITVNRWPHGYGYEYNPLFDPEWPEAEKPNVIGRQRFGRIAIANTDSAATAYTDQAIDQAWRAVGELLT
ncbi:MAG TPA: NAD(P)/FAD-dependent oxidoreductase [Terriglobales bacterium]|nr:NAD(P)/FAD-dependent oxidoreductase [Terriglobales bacterium]